MICYESKHLSGCWLAQMKRLHQREIPVNEQSFCRFKFGLRFNGMTQTIGMTSTIAATGSEVQSPFLEALNADPVHQPAELTANSWINFAGASSYKVDITG